MTEKCPARAIETSDLTDYINESRVPDECMRCIQRAVEDPSATRNSVERYDEALNYVREFVEAPELDADGIDTWTSTMLKFPAAGLGRQALIEHGFDLGLIYGQSYVNGTETEIMTLTFDCYEEYNGEV